MTSTTTAAFRRAYGNLPERIRVRAREAYRHFKHNPSHPSLQFKQVHASREIYSARVSYGYRALAIRSEDAWIWFWIGSHAEYDQLLRRL